ncbi:UNVERIFIED_CONTAM: hypothetical protein Sangu_1992000 [Sesamum angustifolium]|uniref:Uncharacterized protein n=1 Tax=Sesamum angustifolium TaxID=2727405 RepID=A0AAW2LHZ1_9LAMI
MAKLITPSYTALILLLCFSSSLSHALSVDLSSQSSDAAVQDAAKGEDWIHWGYPHFFPSPTLILTLAPGFSLILPCRLSTPQCLPVAISGRPRTGLIGHSLILRCPPLARNGLLTGHSLILQCPPVARIGLPRAGLTGHSLILQCPPVARIGLPRAGLIGHSLILQFPPVVSSGRPSSGLRITVPRM